MAKDVVERFGSCVDLGEAVGRAVERPTEGTTSIDAMLEAASAPHLDGNGAASERIELERTPLSSRDALERAARRSDRPMLTPYGETPSRPSIIIRKQTHRLQNVVAAAALVVIVALIVMGKRQNDGVAREDAARNAASASASAATAARPLVVVPTFSLTPARHPGVRAHPAGTPSAGAATADAGPAVATSAPSAPGPSASPTARDD